jgi:acetylornithine deacetylase/succinyl-diaminopimelate desuccinylase-like protein
MQRIDWTDVVGLTGRLVECPSHADAGEKRAAEVAYEAMLALGYEHVNIDDLGNVTGEIPGSDRDGRYVVLDGHLDTVGVGDADLWTSGPFTASERGSKLFGRGTADMKGAIAVLYSSSACCNPACSFVYFFGLPL